jgi:hypothetical protein
VVLDKKIITPTTNTTTTSSSIDQRKFHTSAYKFNSKKLNNLSIAPCFSCCGGAPAGGQPPTPVINNTLVPQLRWYGTGTPHSLEKKSIISDYLDSLKQIVADAFNGDISQREAAQLKFENT